MRGSAAAGSCEGRRTSASVAARSSERELTSSGYDRSGAAGFDPRCAEANRPHARIDGRRGVAQLVARLLWEQEVAGAGPATPTVRAKSPNYADVFSVNSSA